MLDSTTVIWKEIKMSVVKFFRDQYRSACQMDMAKKLNGEHTHYWIEAATWIDKYKATLSASKQKEFDKEWDKLDEEYFSSLKKSFEPDQLVEYRKTRKP